MELWEVELEELATNFNKDSQEINIYIFSQGMLQDAFAGDLLGDLRFVQVSVSLVAVYTLFFMGTCSPIHCRSSAAGIALLCVGLSYGASNGFAYMVGGKSAGIHSLLSFLLIGIGVDDCFVISAAID